MYRFFVDINQINDKIITIQGDDFNHIKNVLRMRQGEEISVMVPGDDTEYRCEISEYIDDEVRCKLMFVKESNVELPCNITLYQALPKQDKMELIVQKAVELGVSRIVPVATKRAVVKLDGAREDKKITRWNSIAEAAAKQSKRAIIPEVTGIKSLKEAISDCKETEIKLIPYEQADADSMEKTRNIISNIKPGQSVAIFIGPEGGFAEEEVAECMESSIIPITLGHRILRTETAGFTVLAWLVLMLDN